MAAARLESAFAEHQMELLGYLQRMVARPAIAEELLQETMARALEHDVPTSKDELRYWLFRVASRLAIDHLRRHSSWRETSIGDARREAESRPTFLDAAAELRGDPEMSTIAREHLIFCLSCVLGQLEPDRAAVLLLKEVYGFTNGNVAEMLGLTFGQAKQWLQDARRHLRRHYGTTCALIEKNGVCHQCTELDGFFNGGSANPLSGASSEGALEARLEVLREHRDTSVSGPFHRALSGVIVDLLDDA